MEGGVVIFSSSSVLFSFSFSLISLLHSLSVSLAMYTELSSQLLFLLRGIVAVYVLCFDQGFDFPLLFLHLSRLALQHLRGFRLLPRKVTRPWHPRYDDYEQEQHVFSLAKHGR